MIPCWPDHEIPFAAPVGRARCAWSAAAWLLALIAATPSLAQTASQPAASQPVASPAKAEAAGEASGGTDAAAESPLPAGGSASPAAAPAASAPPGEKPPASDAAAEAAAPEPAAAVLPPRPLYEQDPYDLITLDEANDSLVLKVLPLELPDRKLPEASKRVGKLTVRPFDKREEQYEVMWRHVASVDLFEALVLKEAETLVMRGAQSGRAGEVERSQREFDDAYDHFHWLLSFYPNLEGLTKAVQDFLYLNSGTLYMIGAKYEADAGAAPDAQQAARLSTLAYQNFARGFAVLEQLYQQNPEYSYGATNTAVAAMERVGDRLINWYARQGDFVAARRLLKRLQKQYGEALEVTQTWSQRLIAGATSRRDAAAAHLAADRLPEAHDSSREMLRIWPEIEGGRELVLEIARQYPLVVVGVANPVRELNPASLHSFASRRGGQLVYPTLVEYRERGPEGGRYASPFGTVQQSDDRASLIFDLQSEPQQPPFTGYDLSGNLLAVADPASPRYDPAWASLMSSLRVQDVMRVHVALRRPHVLPQSMLRTTFRIGDTTASRYARETVSETEARFTPVGPAQTADGVRPVIVERYYAEPRDAIDALRKGKVDVLDRLLPTDAQRLQQDPSLYVGSYSFPTLFVLVPNAANPYLANRTFRRALVYAINREIILNKGLRGGAAADGSRVISAPLPAGTNAGDLSAYAYDERIAPYPYDPVMAAILVSVATQQLAAAAEQQKQTAPELGELLLVHPAGELPRFIARQIQTQLQVAEVACKTQELPPGETPAGTPPGDLLLMEIQMPEPLVDLPRLLGPGGITPTSDPYVSLALRQLQQAENWKEARERLFELHRQLHNDMTLIPLWQMTEYFAYHRGLRAVRERPLSLYENVDNWRVIPPEHED